MDNQEIRKAIVILSGGMDSATALYVAKSMGIECIALSVHYGQRHAIELDHASRIARAAEVQHYVADLRPISGLLLGSSLTSKDIAVPHGHYADESMRSTVVPNRNMLLLSVAGAMAVSQKAQAVIYGAHAGDHAIYPDCRPQFAEAMSRALMLCDYEPIMLMRPFINYSKAQIAIIGRGLAVPFELTWSCYEGNPPYHCGECGTCVERKEAFEIAGIPDPTEYAQ